MQLTKTFFPNSVIFIEKKWVENRLLGKSAFLWEKKKVSSGSASLPHSCDWTEPPQFNKPEAPRELPSNTQRHSFQNLGVSQPIYYINQGVNGHTTRAPPGVPHTRVSLGPGTSGFSTLRINYYLLGGAHVCKSLLSLNWAPQFNKPEAPQELPSNTQRHSFQTVPASLVIFSAPLLPAPPPHPASWSAMIGRPEAVLHRGQPLPGLAVGWLLRVPSTVRWIQMGQLRPAPPPRLSSRGGQTSGAVRT